MIILGKYDELGPGMGFPSIKDDFQKEPYECKEAILDYLRKGKVHMVSPGIIVDAISGENTNRRLVHMNDGVFCWSSKIIYYVEHYNLRLPKEFEEYVLNTER